MREAKGARKKLAHERTGARVPKAPVVAPDPPSTLSGTARNIWMELVPELHASQVLTTLDLRGLERLCLVWQEVEELTQFIEENGRVVEMIGSQGQKQLKVRPEQSLLADADRRLLQYLVQFGLTPAARTRVHAQGDRKDDADSPEAQYFDLAA